MRSLPSPSSVPISMPQHRASRCEEAFSPNSGSRSVGAKDLASDKMSTEPFQEIPFDGAMGLGFKDLYMSGGFNIVDNLAEKGSIPGGASQFSFYMADGEDCEVTFSGYRPEISFRAL